MSIEFVQPFFNYGTNTGRNLVSEFRQRIFEEMASAGQGMIFTYLRSLNLDSEKEYIDSITKIFSDRGARISFVELSAPFEERKKRNRSELRLSLKASKRNLDWSEANLVQNENEYRMNTNSDFYYPETHLKIDNSLLSPDDVADRIIQKFKLL